MADRPPRACKLGEKRVNATLHRLPESELSSAEELDDFSVFYRRYWPRLVRLVERRTGDKELAQDIAQETLTRALNNIHALDASGSLWPWLKTVALRLAIDHGRRRGREVLVEATDESKDHVVLPDDRADLDSLISTLPKRQRVAIALRYVEGWKSTDAAAFLGLNRVAFEQLLVRARRSLRTQYARMAREAMGLLVFGRAVRERARSALFSSRLGRVERAGSSLVHGAHAVTTHVVIAVVSTLVAAGPALDARLPARTPVAIARSDHSADAKARGNAPARASKPAARKAGGAPASQALAAPAARRAAAERSDGPRPADRLPADDPSLPQRAFDDVTDPNKNVKQPEDARILSLASAPGGDPGSRTVFAAGDSSCRMQPCPPVLFRSDDGGASWTRVAAEGMRGSELAIPEGFGPGNERLFAMGPAGLQVSDDGGATFELAALAGAAFATGSVALSPNFSQGDPTILIGAQTLVEYDDADRSSKPRPATALHGPFEPAFAPQYPIDRRIVLGGLRIGEQGAEAAVYLCRGAVCDETALPGLSGSPAIRLASDFALSGRAYAFTGDGIHVSHDGARSFAPLDTPWSGAVEDVVIDGRGGVLAAVAPGQDDPGGLFVSLDGGINWTHRSPEWGANGVKTLSMAGDTVIAAPQGGGVMCSSDRGLTWDKRC